MMDFPNISEILDFLVANLGVLDKSMISGRFPHAKQKLSPEKLFPEKLVPEKLFPETDENAFWEKFLGGNVSGGVRFPLCPDFRDFSGFLDFWESSASWISLK